MTPKEKAKYLVDRFIEPTIKYNTINGIGYYHDFKSAKQCALIAVDEILEILDFDLGHDDTARGLCTYWQEVKKEIEKL